MAGIFSAAKMFFEGLQIPIARVILLLMSNFCTQSDVLGWD